MAKYKLKGFGKAGALLVFSMLAGTPLYFLTTGFLGKITFFFLTKIMSGFASKGLVILNIGVDFITTAIEKGDFDDALEKAIQDSLEKILSTKRKLTKEEAKEIDEPVKNKFRKFVILA